MYHLNHSRCIFVMRQTQRDPIYERQMASKCKKYEWQMASQCKKNNTVTVCTPQAT